MYLPFFCHLLYYFYASICSMFSADCSYKAHEVRSDKRGVRRSTLPRRTRSFIFARKPASLTDFTFLTLIMKRKACFFFCFCRLATNGNYSIWPNGVEGQKQNVYCQMNRIPGCRDGGWTLVMKIDGKKVMSKVLNLRKVNEERHQGIEALQSEHSSNYA